MDYSGGLRVQIILIVSFLDLYTFKYKSKNGSFDTLVLCQKCNWRSHVRNFLYVSKDEKITCSVSVK